MDDEFDKILEGALEKARNIKCSPEEYRGNMQHWMEQIQVEISACNLIEGRDDDEDG